MRFVAQGVFRAPEADLAQALAALGAPRGVDMQHRFTPIGHSWVRWTHDRQIALHSWPEHHMVTVDVLSKAPMDLSTALAALGWTRLEDPS